MRGAVLRAFRASLAIETLPDLGCGLSAVSEELSAMDGPTPPATAVVTDFLQ